ncbi:MAG: YrhA family protein [Alphaproteobacteria bacterium]|jgi:hypothetical protein|nr:YrhA family protein [Alphaproteobacteria bacterium]
MVLDKKYKLTLFPPIPEDKIYPLRSKMEKSFKCAVPDEYSKLFSITNGMLFDNVVFYGDKEQKRIDYELPSIFEINEVFERIGVGEKFIIGKWLNLLIIYDGLEMKYKIVSKINLMENESFTSIYELIKYLKNIVE